MSDISAEIIKTDTTEIINTAAEQKEKELQDRFQEQSEWYRLYGGTCLCDCINCINARKVNKNGNFLF